MKKELIISLKLTSLCLIVFCLLYPAAVWLIAQMAPGKGEGKTISANGKYYYENIAQKFTDDKYFWSRPSAVAYNAAGSGGSNKGPANPEYLAMVQQRIDTFLAHNPDVKKEKIPSELVTASGSGLDPNISVEGAMVQAARIARIRGIKENYVTDLVIKYKENPCSAYLALPK